MTCHELDLRLDEWIDGALAAEAAREVEEHLRGCEACRAEERRLRQLLAHAASLPRSLAPPRDLWPGIAEELAGRSSWLGLRGFQPVLLAAAAAVALAVGALVLIRVAPENVRTVTMPSATPTTGTLVSASTGSETVAAEREYEDAARALLEALQRRRGVLPPEELTRVEGNLQVIDRALAEVREALVKDPANPELNRMLVATHRKKVDVLRRVVRLSTVL